jgi:hypothetical protein
MAEKPCPDRVVTVELDRPQTYAARTLELGVLSSHVSAALHIIVQQTGGVSSVRVLSLGTIVPVA